MHKNYRDNANNNAMILNYRDKNRNDDNRNSTSFVIHFLFYCLQLL